MTRTEVNLVDHAESVSEEIDTLEGVMSIACDFVDNLVNVLHDNTDENKGFKILHNAHALHALIHTITTSVESLGMYARDIPEVPEE